MGQTPAERMAALILDEEAFESIDPAHPLGGKDGGADSDRRFVEIAANVCDEHRAEWQAEFGDQIRSQNAGDWR